MAGSRNRVRFRRLQGEQVALRTPNPKEKHMTGKRSFALVALAALAFLALPWNTAHADVGISIGVSGPICHHYYRPCYRPVIVARPPVVARPVVVVEPAPVYYSMTPVYVRPAYPVLVVYPIR